MAQAKLNDKQKQFAAEYIIDLNATQAAIRCGYSEKTAYSQGERLLRNVEVAKLIADLKAKRAEKTEITAEMVLRELAKIGFSNIQDFIKKGFEIDDIQELSREHAAAIESIKIKTTHGDHPSTEVSFKLHSKQAALDMIGKHIGFFATDNKQKNPTIKQSFKFGDQVIEF